MYRNRTVERLLREKDREVRALQYLMDQNERLLDRLMVLAGQRAYEPPAVIEPEPEPEIVDYFWSPEQEIDAEPELVESG